MINKIIQGDNLVILPTIPLCSVSMIYIDPPFNTGKVQRRGDLSYQDTHEDFEPWLMKRVEAALPCLKSNGSLFVHLDYREVHYVKVALDKLFGRDKFMNEVIWAYDYGGRSKSRWSAKHDTILWYTLDPKNYTFNFGEMDRVPYMAPGLVGPEKAAKGKTPTTCWVDSLRGTDVQWHTIVPTNGHEKTGYPTQKPVGLLERFIKVHTNPGDTVFDFFAGSGTTGDAAAKHGRNFTLIDESDDAISVMTKRLAKYNPIIETSTTVV